MNVQTQVANLFDDPAFMNLFYIFLVLGACFAIFFIYTQVTKFKSGVNEEVEKLNGRIDQYNVNNPFEVLERFNPSEIGKRHCAEKLENTKSI